MPFSRRDCLRTAGAALAGAALRLHAAAPPPGIPGPFLGKVVGVTDANCLRAGRYQAKPIRAMLDRGMTELTGVPAPPEAWRRFFGPSDIVGIKVSPVGAPHVCSSPELLNAIIDALEGLGIPPGHIVVYDRYREALRDMGVASWIPRNVAMEHAAIDYDEIQLGMDGYDPDSYVELPFVLPGQESRGEAARRSHAALFISRHVTKLINLPVLKSHNASGVTLALKNLSHGLVNNVTRSHEGPAPRFNEFIPAVVSMPVIRNKTVLHILDGTKGLFHGGPGVDDVKFVWEHKTIYFATDPVAVDVIGRGVIAEKRQQKGLRPLDAVGTDNIWKRPRRQPEHIESAGRAGLGESDRARIEFRPISLA